MPKKKNDTIAEDKTSNKKQKLPPLIEHIQLMLDDTPKLSLPALKSQLKESRGTDFTQGASNTRLKNALVAGCSANKFSKEGGSYVKFGYVPPVTQATTEQPVTEPRWRGLKVLNREKAKSRKSKCQQCGRLIDQGSPRLQVMDDSLFKACVLPGDCHEGVYRGYVECAGPSGETVARKKFFVHPECLADANTSCEAAFWANLPLLDPELFDR